MFAALALGAPLGTAFYSAGGLAAVAIAATLMPLLTVLLVFRLSPVAPQREARAPLGMVAAAVWLPGFGSALSSVGFGAIIASGVGLPKNSCASIPAKQTASRSILGRRSCPDAICTPPFASSPRDVANLEPEGPRDDRVSGFVGGAASMMIVHTLDWSSASPRSLPCGGDRAKLAPSQRRPYTAFLGRWLGGDMPREMALVRRHHACRIVSAGRELCCCAPMSDQHAHPRRNPTTAIRPGGLGWRVSRRSLLRIRLANTAAAHALPSRRRPVRVALPISGIS
jgi:hypothetical protein